MLGENLKSERLRHGFTQRGLAGIAQVSRVTLACFENGTKVPSLAVLVRLADALDCSVDSLLDRKVTEQESLTGSHE